MGGLSGISSGYGLQSWIKAFDKSSLAVTNAASDALAAPDSAGVAAAPDSPGSSASGTSGSSSSSAADLIDGLVGSDLAAYGVKASIAVLRTADEMLGTVIDLQA